MRLRSLLYVYSALACVLLVGREAQGQAVTHVVGIIWTPEATGACHDHTLTGGDVCLVRSRGDKIIWLIKNDCADGVFQFTLKDRDPVTGCTISPSQPNFIIESPFPIRSGGAATVRCVVHAQATVRTCMTDELKYTVTLLKSAKGVSPGNKGPQKLSHELDLGVNP